MVYIYSAKLFKKMEPLNDYHLLDAPEQVINEAIDVQKAMKRLFMDIIKADLRALQLKIRKSEHTVLINICVEAEQYGLDTSKLRQASDDIAGEVTPYTENPAKSTPEIMLTLVGGFTQIINGYGAREPARVAKMHSVLQHIVKQKNYMFNAVQAGINPEKILFMTDELVKRYKGCQEYNQRIISIIADKFEANDNAHVLKSVTAYLLLLEFAAPYASYNNDGLILFAYRQRLKALTDAAGEIKVIHIDFQQDGLFHEAMQEQNKDSYEEQGNNMDYIMQLHSKVTYRYIADILRTSETKIQQFYRENATEDNKTLMEEIGRKMRTGFYNNLFGSIQNAFRQIIEANRNLIGTLTNNYTQKQFLQESPMNVFLEQIAHNPISSTKHARKTNAEFLANLKRVVKVDKKLEDMLTNPRFKAYKETLAMNPANRAAEGLATTMDMDIDEASEELHGLREEPTLDITIYGNYILTRTDYRQYPDQFPVIQIQELLTGSVIVGVNDAAAKLRFRENMFIASIEVVDNDEIDKFLQDAGREAAAAKVRVTKFRLVWLGRKKQDRQDRDEQLLDKALSDQVPVLDDTFWDTIK